MPKEYLAFVPLSDKGRFIVQKAEDDAQHLAWVGAGVNSQALTRSEARQVIIALQKFIDEPLIEDKELGFYVVNYDGEHPIQEYDVVYNVDRVDEAQGWLFVGTGDEWFPSEGDTLTRLMPET